MFNQFAKHEDAFRDWRRDGLPGLKAKSYKYIEFLTSKDDDQAARQGTLWPHQWESFLRLVYAHDILGKTKLDADGLLLNIVTGGGHSWAYSGSHRIWGLATMASTRTQRRVPGTSRSTRAISNAA